MRRHLILVSLLGLIATLAACEGNFCLVNCDGGQSTAGPSALPSPTVTPSPSPSPSPTPKDPCNPVTGLDAAGPTEVQIGNVIAFDLTPTTPDGRLEGTLDYCNAGRFPTVERASANLRCVGSCGGWRPQFTALAVGPFEVQFRLGGVVSPIFSGTVTR